MKENIEIQKFVNIHTHKMYSQSHAMRGVLKVMVIVIRNIISVLSSNPRGSYVSICTKAFGESIESFCSPFK